MVLNQNKNLSFTVVVPTWNRAYCLWRTILSIQNQTFTNWTLLIVDDNSTDDTEKLVREFSSDQRIKLIKNNKMHSVAGGRQAGLEQADSDLIAYLDSDNLAHPDWLANMEQLFSLDNSCHFAYPSMNYKLDFVVDNKYKSVEHKILPNVEITAENILSHSFEADSNGLVHRLNLVDNGLSWNLDLKHYEDYEFALQLLTIEPNGLKHLNRVLIDYTRLYDGNGVCNIAEYSNLVKSLKTIRTKYNKIFSTLQSNWLDITIKKYIQLDASGAIPRDKVAEKFRVYEK
jgi:glycosyltransferase involved in cell wall biosynthesis